VRFAFAALSLAVAAAASGCHEPEPRKRLAGQVRVTFLHTADVHSRLFPYNLQIGQVDSQLGLGEVGSIRNVGGVARISYIVGRERARASRVLHLDGGDCFQGAPIFNFYSGEAEIRTLAAMGADAMLVANHEFDKGALNLAMQIQQHATFPVLVANYRLEDPAVTGASPLGSVVQPFQTYDLAGLKVGVIGMGNLSSLTSIFDQPNRLGVLPLKTSHVAQFYVDLLRPLVDVVVVLSHLGLEFDERMIETTTGIDVVLGGHNHIVLQPPKRLRDCARVDADGRHYVELASAAPADPEAEKECQKKKQIDPAADCDGTPVTVRRYCRPREVLLAHSGAFAKYVGRLDVVVSNDPADFTADFAYDPVNGFEVVSQEYRLFPVNDSVPEDPIVRRTLEPYALGLDVLADLDLLVGFAPEGARRFSLTGGDSALGNMIATSMWLRLGIQTDFGLTNTTGIRADLVPGAVTAEQLFNIFPFDNSITKMQLSGVEVQELFDFVARRSAGRGCDAQAQLAGARVVLNCTTPNAPPRGPGKAEQIYIGVVDPPRPCACDNECANEGPGVACTCGEPCAAARLGQCDTNIGRCWQPIDAIASYELATSNYLAQGGSGYSVLKRNTTQFDTKIVMRDALIDYLRGGEPCGTVCKESAETCAKICEEQPSQCARGLHGCATDEDCETHPELGPGYVCACPEVSVECAPEDAPCAGGAQCCSAQCVMGKCAGGGAPRCLSDPEQSCAAVGASADPGPGQGACVLASCREDVAQSERAVCERAPTKKAREACLLARAPCVAGGETCKFLACIDRGLGNFEDGRVRMLAK
jgi:5'-nucleotidase